MRVFSNKDCEQTSYDVSLKNKVVVLSKSVLPKEHPEQLFFCINDSNSIRNSMFLVSLSTGENYQFPKESIIGLLKPELLPKDAKLHLSQIRPQGVRNLSGNEPEYYGYSFLPDGQYAAGVQLCSTQEVMDYVEMQKPYQHRVLICDLDDFAVMEVINGKVIFPTQEDIEKFRQEQKPDGITMT